jgi:hypothetical protein
MDNIQHDRRNAATAKSIEEAIEIYIKGVEAGERTIGEQSFLSATSVSLRLVMSRDALRISTGLQSLSRKKEKLTSILTMEPSFAAFRR